MRQSLIAALAWSSWASAGANVHTLPVQRDVPAVVGMDLYGREVSRPLMKRDTATLGTGMFNHISNTVNVSIGTPPQYVGMMVDFLTATFDVFYEDTRATNSECREIRYCSLYGSYNATKSTSNVTKEIPNRWGEPYKVFTDTVTIGGTKVKDVELRRLTVEHDNYNSIGLSPSNESFPYQLVDRGLIRSPSFSLWGNSSEGGAGLLFGGINKAKYHGPLQAYSFNKTWGSVSLPLSRFQLQTESKTPTNYTLSSSKPYMLSAQYITTTLPKDAVLRMYKDYNISYVGWSDDDDPQFGLLPCSRQYTETRTVSLFFGSATISANWSDLFIPWGSAGSERCSFLIQPEDDMNSSYAGRIGTKFSERMYMTINYNNGFVGVAALNENPGADDIVEIGDGPEIPDAVGDFPTSIVPYKKPKPTVSMSTSTSTGLASMPTYMPGGMFVGVAGAALVAAL